MDKTFEFNLITPINFDMVFKKKLNVSNWKYIPYDEENQYKNGQLIYKLYTKDFILNYNYFSIKFMNLIDKKTNKPGYFKIPLSSLYKAEIIPTNYGIFNNSKYEFNLEFNIIDMYINFGTSVQNSESIQFFRYLKKRINYEHTCANKIQKYYLKWKKIVFDI